MTVILENEGLILNFRYRDNRDIHFVGICIQTCVVRSQKKLLKFLHIYSIFHHFTILYLFVDNMQRLLAVNCLLVASLAHAGVVGAFTATQLIRGEAMGASPRRAK